MMIIMMYACLSLVFFLSVSFFPHKLCTVRVRTPYTVSVNDGPLLFPHRKKKNKAQYTCGFLVRIELGVYFFSSPTSSPSHSFYIYTCPRLGGNVCRFQVVVTMMMWFLSGW